MTDSRFAKSLLFSFGIHFYIVGFGCGIMGAEKENRVAG
jgi:hypothetical protein